MRRSENGRGEEFAKQFPALSKGKGVATLWVELHVRTARFGSPQSRSYQICLPTPTPPDKPFGWGTFCSAGSADSHVRRAGEL